MNNRQRSPLGRACANVCASASAVVHWVWVFLAWGVLADVGQRTAQGLGTMLPLVVWWVWLVARPLPPQRLPALWRLVGFPVLTAMGLGISYKTGSTLAALLTAAAWAQTCIQSQQISRAIGPRRARLVWASPVLAAVWAWALLVGWAPQHSAWVMGLLLLGALVLSMATWPLRGTVVTCPVLSRRLSQGWRTPGMAGASAQAAQLAMGLMMGSLAISGQWCTQAGWPAGATLGLHLLLMALAAGLAQTLCALASAESAAHASHAMTWQVHLPWARAACLVAGGLALLTWSGPHGLLVCMVCHCLAWGLSLSGQPSAESAMHGMAERWIWAALCGCSLAWLAWGAATWGPWVLVWAHGAVSLVGLLALLNLVWRAQGRTPGVSSAMS